MSRTITTSIKPIILARYDEEFDRVRVGIPLYQFERRVDFITYYSEEDRPQLERAVADRKFVSLVGKLVQKGAFRFGVKVGSIDLHPEFSVAVLHGLPEAGKILKTFLKTLYKHSGLWVEALGRLPPCWSEPRVRRHSGLVAFTVMEVGRKRNYRPVWVNQLVTADDLSSLAKEDKALVTPAGVAV